VILMGSLENIRRLFPVTGSKLFLNHAGVSPLPKPVVDAMVRYVEGFSTFDRPEEPQGHGKPLFAKLIGARPEEITLVENTSVGLNIAANVLKYESRPKVVIADIEYPSVVYPWLRRRLGAKVHYVKSVNWGIPVEDVERAVDDRTAAVIVSHVQYASGFRSDLKALSDISHRYGALLIVDAVQSAGALRIDVKRDGVDFLACSCYKWLLGPTGIGYLYIRGDLIGELEPPYVGWLSVKPEVFETVDLWDVRSLNLSETASRFEVGEPSGVSIAGAGEAMRMLLDFGMENVEKRVLGLTEYLIERLKSMGFELQTPEEPEHRSGIVNFKVSDPAGTVERLRSMNIVVSARARGVRGLPPLLQYEGGDRRATGEG